MAYRFDARGALLPKFLGGVIVLFVGIMIACYIISRQADPVMLDEKGHVRNAHPAGR